MKIETVSPVSFAKLAQQVKTGVYEFDVTTLGAGELLRAEEAGLLEPIAEPYAGGLFHGGAGSHAFATVIGYNGKKFADGPKTWADFWDVKKFPGARSLQRYPARILPLALLADGVPMDKLYPLDIDRAFAALDRIKEHVVVWWTAGAQSSQILRDGEVDLCGIWHGRFFEAQAGAPHLQMTWNQAQQERAYWCVAKNSPNRDAAEEFVKFATSAESLAKFCIQADYGPLNPGSMQFVSDDQAKRMPTYPANYAQTFEQDIENFGGDIAAVSERFEEWLAS
ncbi:extracellular solute-binding protein [Gemmobacter sp.]|uniref:extracellular solute-binding protein n=1 Tax=Gemmobacter sp. TaxID=1898957 RepID=UPI002AFF1715|nr:extracellular solute-binding protein [Gemmobacter sp.]